MKVQPAGYELTTYDSWAPSRDLDVRALSRWVGTHATYLIYALHRVNYPVLKNSVTQSSPTGRRRPRYHIIRRRFAEY